MNCHNQLIAGTTQSMKLNHQSMNIGIQKTRTDRKNTESRLPVNPVGLKSRSGGMFLSGSVPVNPANFVHNSLNRVIIVVNQNNLNMCFL